MWGYVSVLCDSFVPDNERCGGMSVFFAIPLHLIMKGVGCVSVLCDSFAPDNERCGGMSVFFAIPLHLILKGVGVCQCSL